MLERFEKMVDLWREMFELDDLFYEKIISSYSPGMIVDSKFAYKYLIRFLELWGVSSAAKINPSDLAQRINSNSHLITELSIPLTRADLEELGPKILDLIHGMKIPNLGPTSISKILHLLDPKLFVMWDHQIRRKYGVNPDPNGYLDFLKKMKQFGNEILDQLSRKYAWSDPEGELSKKYGKPFTKLIDEYNWLSTRRWIERIEV